MSYRCPKSHVRLANEWGSGQLRACPNAVEGVIIRGASFASHPPRASAAHAVLARTNASLLALGRKLAARNLAFRMIGRRDVAERLLKLLDHHGKAGDVHSLRRNLQTYMRTHINGEDGDVPVEGKEEERDYVQCLWLIVQDLEQQGSQPLTVAAVRAQVQSMYNAGDGVPGADQLTLSTVHRAKGLEWERVYLLQPGQLPLWFVMEYGQPWAQQQERNLMYVAVTRALQELVFLRDVAQMDTLFAAPHPAPGAGTGAEGGSPQSATDTAAGTGTAEAEVLRDVTWALGLLGLGATPQGPQDREQVRKAYYQRLMDWHPDKQQQKEDEAARLPMKRAHSLTSDLFEAWGILQGVFVL